MSPGEVIDIGEFMRRALHDPERGYYANRIKAIGRRGDFTTAPVLDDTLARAVAAWAAAALRESGCRDLLEIGPGGGVLAAAVWRHLPWRLRWRTRLHLVETSAPLRAIQQALLGSRARWHEHPSSALAACAGRAVIFSNELVDAFPARVFENSATGWREVGLVADSSGRIAECLLGEAALPESSSFDIDHPPGQRVEVHYSYRLWLDEWLPRWKAGRMLTIDYGGRAGALYHRRPRGTLRGYLLQQRLEAPEIYQNAGRVDLTADVNFTDLAAWPGTCARVRVLQTLAEFIQKSGLGGCEGILTDPAGAGGAFLVLDQECAAQ